MSKSTNDRGRGYLARRQHALQRDTNGRYTQYWGPLCSEDGGADLRRIRNRNKEWLDPDTHVHWSTRAKIGSEIIAITVRTQQTHWVHRRLVVLVYDELDCRGGDGVVCVEAKH